MVLILAALGGGLYLYFRSPQITIALTTRDGAGLLTYRCKITQGAAEAQGRAAAADVFFQDQLAVIATATAEGMQDAMDTANAAGTTPDFDPIETVQADLIAATVSVVEQMYGCTVTPPAAEGQAASSG